MPYSGKLVLLRTVSFRSGFIPPTTNQYFTNLICILFLLVYLFTDVLLVISEGFPLVRNIQGRSQKKFQGDLMNFGGGRAFIGTLTETC